MNTEIIYRGALNEGAVQASAWVQAAQSGSLSAFNHLVLMHQDGLYRWVYSLMKDEALADDITQLTFITAFKKISTFRGGSFRAWLFTIARNRSIDEMRSKKRYPSMSIDDSPDDDRELLSILPDGSPLPEDGLIAAERSKQVEQLLNHLPRSFQEVLWLVDIEDLEYQQAAQILGLPIGTLKSRLNRARLKMRQMVLESSIL
jgi:RNA polymerase sigma-70 factor (ECF subfamily)